MTENRLFRLWLCFCIMLFLLVSVGLFMVNRSHAGTLPSTLTWTNTNTGDKLQIEKGASLTGPFTTLAQVPALTTTYLDATNSPGDNSCYRVAYFNTSRQSRLHHFRATVESFVNLGCSRKLLGADQL